MIGKEKKQLILIIRGELYNEKNTIKTNADGTVKYRGKISRGAASELC